MRLKLMLAAPLLAFVLIGCHSSEEATRIQQKNQQAERAEHYIADLRDRYNPVTDWPQQLKGKAYTSDIEPIFLRPDHRPFLFYAMLEDVKHENGEVTLYLTTVATEGEPALRLILDCAGCNLQDLKKSAESVGDFGWIVQVTAAAKLLDGDENAPDFVVHGKFIDARFIGDYALDKLLAVQAADKYSSK